MSQTLNVGFQQNPLTLYAKRGFFGVRGTPSSLVTANNSATLIAGNGSFSLTGQSATLGSSGGDGAVISSGVLTVTRAAGGFGTKTTAAPLFFNDFEGQSVGATCSACGLTNPIDATSVLVANDKSYSGTKSLKGIFPQSTESFPEVSLVTTGALQIYCSAWTYWDAPNGFVVGGTTISPIFKWCRGGSNNSGGLYHGFPQFYQTLRSSTGTVTGGDWGYKDDNSVVAWSQSMYNGVNLPGPTYRQWNYSEYSYALNNPASATNGVVQMWNNGRDMFPAPYVNQLN